MSAIADTYTVSRLCHALPRACVMRGVVPAPARGTPSAHAQGIARVHDPGAFSDARGIWRTHAPRISVTSRRCECVSAIADVPGVRAWRLRVCHGRQALHAPCCGHRLQRLRETAPRRLSKPGACRRMGLGPVAAGRRRARTFGSARMAMPRRLRPCSPAGVSGGLAHRGGARCRTVTFGALRSGNLTRRC